MKLEKVKSWFYQLQGVPDPETLVADLLVIDIDEDPQPYLVKRDGTPRAVAAYLSIGEAEDYRSYWKRLHERKHSSTVILGENFDWRGNYTVRYWDTGWQAIIMDRIREAKRKGFTALYLDKVDAFEDIERKWPHEAERIDLKEAMINFVILIASCEPGLSVIMQNAEALTDFPRLLAAIDAIGKEDLFFGVDETGKPNTPSDTRWALEQLHKSQKPVFVIEYLDSDEDKVHALRLIQASGMVPFFDEEDRELDGI